MKLKKEVLRKGVVRAQSRGAKKVKKKAQKEFLHKGWVHDNILTGVHKILKEIRRKV